MVFFALFVATAFADPCYRFDKNTPTLPTPDSVYSSGGWLNVTLHYRGALTFTALSACCSVLNLNLWYPRDLFC